MTDITFHLKKKWFEQVKAGRKKVEYRVQSPYWIQRLRGRTYDKIVICLGYPKDDDKSKRLYFFWSGVDEIELEHEEWGHKKRRVFAIPLHEVPF